MIAQQIGLSAEFLRDRSLIPMDKTVEEVLARWSAHGHQDQGGVGRDAARPY